MKVFMKIVDSIEWLYIVEKHTRGSFFHTEFCTIIETDSVCVRSVCGFYQDNNEQWVIRSPNHTCLDLIPREDYKQLKTVQPEWIVELLEPFTHEEILTEPRLLKLFRFANRKR